MARFDRLELGQSPEPEPDPSQSAKQEPQDHRYWLKRADTERRRGLYETALRHYSRALEQHRTLVTGWLGQVQMLVLLRELPEADLWARKALEVFPGNGELMAARAQALCRLGDKRQAVQLSDGAMAASGTSAYRWMTRGESLLIRRQSLHAHCFDKALEADRDWLVAAESALIYLYHRAPSAAHIRAREAVARAPSQFYAWYLQGQAEMALGLNRQARQSFEHCLELDLNYGSAKQRLLELSQRPWYSIFSPKRWLRCGR